MEMNATNTKDHLSCDDQGSTVTAVKSPEGHTVAGLSDNTWNEDDSLRIALRENGQPPVQASGRDESDRRLESQGNEKRPCYPLLSLLAMLLVVPLYRRRNINDWYHHLDLCRPLGSNMTVCDLSSLPSRIVSRGSGDFFCFYPL
uniref:Uncharacterized protein n=1 Tax=Grammatophora oceanica TaxID=210454 RepID=A0A7S1VA35_9STRA|mmetsp:Transcript_41053/g.60800  ORF Transcript_41053/g.60800 Transcript_41053/m.60800 type:complete len:145 (+) Transcript_41053:178-612(+)